MDEDDNDFIMQMILLSSLSDNKGDNKVVKPVFPGYETIVPPVEISTAVIQPIEDVKDGKEEIKEEKKVCNKKRCNNDGCNKKLTLMDQTMMCRCDYLFCISHRLPESHNCTYDYATNEKKELEKRNQKCVSDKITKI